MRRTQKARRPASKSNRRLSIVAGVIAPLAIYLICRSAAQAVLPNVAVALPPVNYAAGLRQIARATRDPGYRVSVTELALAKKGSVAMPLAHEPFFVAAKAEEDAGRLDKATVLMQEAKRRRPNNVPIRSKLLVYYGTARNYAGFLIELDYLLRRSEIAKERVFPELIKGISDPSWRGALAEMLAKRPVWREQFLSAAAASKVAPEHAFALVESIRAKGPRGVDLGPERRFHMQTLIAAGRYGAARAVWLQSLGNPQGQELLFNGDFGGPRAAPPFDWSFQELDVGRATVVASGDRPHLEAEYFGGRDAVLAEQLLALSPGAYELHFLARREATATSGRLRWSVSCLPNNNELASVELRKLTPRYASFTERFVVPIGCAGQTLRLVAEAGDFSRPLAASVAELEVRRGT